LQKSQTRRRLWLLQRLLLLLRCIPNCLHTLLLLLLPLCLLLLHELSEAREHPLLLGTAGRRVAATAAGRGQGHTRQCRQIASDAVRVQTQVAESEWPWFQCGAELPANAHRWAEQARNPACLAHLRGSLRSVRGQRGRRSTHSPSASSGDAGGGSTSPSCSLRGWKRGQRQAWKAEARVITEGNGGEWKRIHVLLAALHQSSTAQHSATATNAGRWQPLAHRSTPAQATMTPLSVHSRGGGQTICSPAPSASAVRRPRM
jgi:hypothetical protein